MVLWADRLSAFCGSRALKQDELLALFESPQLFRSPPILQGKILRMRDTEHPISYSMDLRKKREHRFFHKQDSFLWSCALVSPFRGKFQFKNRRFLPCFRSPVDINRRLKYDYWSCRTVRMVGHRRLLPWLGPNRHNQARIISG